MNDILLTKFVKNKRIPSFSAKRYVFGQKIGERIPSVEKKMKGHAISFQLVPNLINMLSSEPI
jgi:hypothetical protein